VLPERRVAGGQLGDALEDAGVGGNAGVGRVVVDRGAVALRGHGGVLEQGLQLAGEDEAALVEPVEERLLAEPVPRHEHGAVAAVPDREGEHAAEALDAAGAALLGSVDDRVRAGAGREAMPGLLQLGLQLDVVVDLAVEHDGHRAVFVEDGLAAALEVDDAEAAVTESDAAPDEQPLTVGSSMAQPPGGPLEELLVDRRAPVGLTDPDDPAHAPPRGGRGPVKVENAGC